MSNHFEFNCNLTTRYQNLYFDLTVNSFELYNEICDQVDDTKKVGINCRWGRFEIFVSILFWFNNTLVYFPCKGVYVEWYCASKRWLTVACLKFNVFQRDRRKQHKQPIFMLSCWTSVNFNQSTIHHHYPQYQAALSRALLSFSGTSFVEAAVYKFGGKHCLFRDWPGKHQCTSRSYIWRVYVSSEFF